MELLPRHVTSWVRELLEISPVVVIEGARQVGKSTLAGILSENAEIVSLTLDDEPTRAFAEDDPIGFLRSAGGKRLIIDEVQRCPRLILPLKAEVDRDRRPGRFILTGSANLLRVPGAEDSLAGRAMTVRLHALSQGELRECRDDWVPKILSGPEASQEWPDRKMIVDAVVSGGYPSVRKFIQKTRVAWLTDYANRLLERDSADLAALRVPVLKQLLGLLAASPGGELVLERFATSLSVSRPTVSAYLNVLESLFLVQLVPSWSRNLTARQVRRPKCYLTDTGLAAALSGMTAPHLTTPQGADHFGPLLENFVVGELTRQLSWSSITYELSHYRDRNGAEVDIVIETPRGIVAVEVKAAGSAARNHFRHLRSMRDNLGGEFLAGVVLHLGPGQQAGERLWALPVTSLWS